MKQFKELDQRVKEDHPEVTTKVAPFLNNDGGTIDIFLKGGQIVVQTADKDHFGVSWCPNSEDPRTGLFDGPDATFTGEEAFEQTQAEVTRLITEHAA